MSQCENEISEADILFAEAYEAMDELAAAQQHQVRFHDELKSSRESLDIAFRELNNCRALHDAACDDLEDASKRTLGCWRATKNHMMAEEVLDNSLGCLGDLVKDTASATHALSWSSRQRQQRGEVLARGP